MSVNLCDKYRELICGESYENCQEVMKKYNQKHIYRKLNLEDSDETTYGYISSYEEDRLNIEVDDGIVTNIYIG